MKTRFIALATFTAAFLTAADIAPLETARHALAKGDLPAAETALTPLTVGATPDTAALHQLGLVRLRQGRAKDAAALFEKAAQLEPSNPEHPSHLGMAISEQMRTAGFMEQALLAGKLRKAFARSVEIDPHHISGLIGLARFYANAPEIAGGSLEKAKEFALRVQKLNPLLGAFELGNVAEREENFADALVQYESAVKLKPDQASAHASAGRMLAKLGRKEDARASFEIALRLDPRREAVKKALAELNGSSTAEAR